MKQREVEVLGGAIQAGIERALERLLDDSPEWRRTLRTVDTEIIGRGVRAGLEVALDKVLLHPFPRRGQPRAIINNARPLMRSAIEKELLKLL